MALTVGVDEAGRGPVLGSMFAAAVLVADPNVLPNGIEDSKRLSSDRREALADTLLAHPRISIGVAEITPSQIDDPETDLNTLGVEIQATAIDAVLADRRTDGASQTGDLDVIVDACDTDESRFGRRVTDSVEADVSVTAEHGADDQHPIVAAASIVAKVERDAHVSKLAEEYGAVGSGYPNDSKTTQFLEAYVAEHGTVPPCARTSWKTCKRLLADHEQTGFGQF